MPSYHLGRVFDPIWRRKVGHTILKKILDAEAKDVLTDDEKEQLLMELKGLMGVAQKTPYLLYPLKATDIERTFNRLKGLWVIDDEGRRVKQ